MSSYRVQVRPDDAGYTLEVPGLRSFQVLDGYDGTLDDVARGLIAAETGVSPASVRVELRYRPMKQFRTRSRFSWPVALAGLATLAVVVVCLATSHPVGAAIGALLGGCVMRYQFSTVGSGDSRQDRTPRVE